MMATNSAADLRCSFCSKPHAEVKKLIAGHGGVAICDECLEVCNDIVADESRRPSSYDEYELTSWDAKGDATRLFSFKCPACGHHWAIDRK